MSREENLKRYQDAGADFIASARMRAEEFLSELASLGESTTRQAGARMEGITDALRNAIRSEVSSQLAALGLTSSGRRAPAATKSPAAGKTAAKKTTTTAKAATAKATAARTTAARKTAAKKAPAKKTAASKATAAKTSTTKATARKAPAKKAATSRTSTPRKAAGS